MFMTRSISRTLLLAAGLSLAALPAWSAPSGGSSGANTTPTVSPKKLKCKRGQVIRTVTVGGVKKRKCVTRTAQLLPDDELFEQGNALALEGEYEWALDVLALVQNQNDPRVLNMQGYSNRKSGRLDVAITYYRKALDINPDFVRAREYLGEGYVAAGRIDLAQAELAQIKSRCGETCDEFKDLAKAIATANN